MEVIINTKATTLDNLGAECGRTLTAEQIGALMVHEGVAERVITIGLSNILKDAHAGMTLKSFKTHAEGLLAKKAKIENTLAALMAGEVRAARATGAPKLRGYELILANCARRAVIAKIQAQATAANTKLTSDAMKAIVESDRVKAAIEAAKTNLKVIAQAQSLWEIEKAKADIDLGDLDLSL